MIGQCVPNVNVSKQANSWIHQGGGARVIALRHWRNQCSFNTFLRQQNCCCQPSRASTRNNGGEICHHKTGAECAMLSRLENCSYQCERSGNLARQSGANWRNSISVSYTHLRAHETGRNLVC